MLLFAGFRIDQRRAELRGPDDAPIKLRPKTYKLLLLLAENAGRVVSKPELMETVWPGVLVGEDTLFQCVREIRAALGDDTRKLVRNVSGRGYLFEAVVTREDPALAEGRGAGTAPANRAGSGEAPGPAATTLDGPTPPRAIIKTGPPAPPATEALTELAATRRWPRLGRPIMIATLAGALAAATLGVSSSHFAPGRTVHRSPPTIAVTAIAPAGDDASSRAFAAGVTDQLIAGLAQIETIRVVAPAATAAKTSLGVVPSRAAPADYVVTSALQKSEHGWSLRTRLTNRGDGEIAWTSTLEVAADGTDVAMQQSRLAAGVGHPLALRLNAILNDATAAAGSVAVQQATAAINHTTPERFRTAQAMLETALADDPDDVDVEAALSALQLRGLQMVWYPPDQREPARLRAQTLLDHALHAKPTYIPVLENECRFLSATNRFAESLVACARVLSFDPWDGIALYHLGLDQFFLGRFEDALASFKQADRFDTPAVSRWTWLLGAGLSDLYLGRNEEAAAWLQRSLAITPGTGRTHLLLVVAYRRLGRVAEAAAMLKAALALRPGATAANVRPPAENTSPVYLAVSEQVSDELVAAGLPKR